MLSDQTRVLSEGLCVSVVKQQVWAAGGGGGCCLAATESRCHSISHLVQEALHQDNQGEGHGVQAEEDVVNRHRVHSIRVFEEKLLLLRGVMKLSEGQPGQELLGLGWAVVGGQGQTLMCGIQKRPTLNTL